MNKIIFFIFACLFFLIKSTAFGTEDLDNIERAMKLQRQQQKYLELQRQQQQQLPKQNIKGLKQGLLPQKEQKPDRSVEKNEERFKQLTDSQKKEFTKNFEDWTVKIPKEQRFIIELFTIALFISFFGFMFYRQKIKKHHEEKEAEDRQKQKSEKKPSLSYKYRYRNYFNK